MLLYFRCYQRLSTCDLIQVLQKFYNVTSNLISLMQNLSSKMFEYYTKGHIGKSDGVKIFNQIPHFKVPGSLHHIWVLGYITLSPTVFIGP